MVQCQRVVGGCRSERTCVILCDRIFCSWNFQSCSLRHVIHKSTYTCTNIYILHIHHSTVLFMTDAPAHTLSFSQFYSPLVMSLCIQIIPIRDTWFVNLWCQHRRTCKRSIQGSVQSIQIDFHETFIKCLLGHKIIVKKIYVEMTRRANMVT